jgi:EAL domain-containing protein (putative c-di-GMP-specific phosphodiesterase class I)
VEALVRWKHPTRGMTFPDTFIPLAERTGLINPLTTWVVEAALRQGVELAQAGLALDLSVNLSARNLHQPGFSQELLKVVRAIGFPLSRLTLELTETAIMADPVRAKTVLGELHDAGIHLSMDDFGIGQSSLTYLKDLPITKMKIDKSFVIGFEQPRNVSIVRSAIDLARNMGLNVTAEGIEDESTYHALRELGCDLGQGYFFSKPLGVVPLTQWLRESPWGIEAKPQH